jgi:predicted AAA+ superfamily ATPase
MKYKPRVVDAELTQRLGAAGAVLIEGPKACGKTQTARLAAASEVLLDIDANAHIALHVDPKLVLDGPTPRLIDEWQLAANTVWNNVRRLVDDRQSHGQFILTGSAVPADDARRHAGSGRFSVLRMRPMSLFELGRSSGQVSLAALLAGDAPSCPDPGLVLRDLIELVCVGGWPTNLTSSVSQSLQANRDYLAHLREVDVSRVGPVSRDPQRLERFLHSLARNTATEASVAVLCADTGDSAEPLSRTTAYDYLDVLARLLVVEDQPAWSVHLRSKDSLRKQPKRHLVDPSLAVAALGASPDRLLADLNMFGCLFESLVLRDLRVLSQPQVGTVYHYRDSRGLEVDAIVSLADGRWGAFEVKLGTAQVDSAAAHLLEFAKRIDTSRVGAPAVLAVVTGSGYGYVRADGVAVVPIGALAP